MQQRLVKTAVTVLTVLLIGGCATSARQLMPTPTLYQLPGGQPVFDRSEETRQSPDLDLLFITDRAPPTPAEIEARAKEKDAGPLPYGQERARGIAFGSAQVRVVPGLDWETLREQSQLAERTREVNLELGPVRELGAFPQEPYQISRGADGKILRDRAELVRHFEAKAGLQGEVQRRLAASAEEGGPALCARLQRDLRHRRLYRGGAVPLPRTGAGLRLLHLARLDPPETS